MTKFSVQVAPQKMPGKDQTVVVQGSDVYMRRIAQIQDEEDKRNEEVKNEGKLTREKLLELGGVEVSEMPRVEELQRARGTKRPGFTGVSAQQRDSRR